MGPDSVRTLYDGGMAQRAEDHGGRRYRIEVRVTPEQNALIRQAADIEDSTVTSFVLKSVTTRAKRVVTEHHDIVLSNESFDRFLAELDTPAQVVPELVDLFKRHPKLPEG